MEKITTNIDRKVTKELLIPNIIFGWVAVGIALVVIALYFVLSIINNDWASTPNLMLAISGGLLLVLSIVLLLSYHVALNKAAEYQRVAIYEFTDNYLKYELYRHDEKIEEGKQYYTDLQDYKETKHYVYIRLKNNAWLAVDKVEGLVDLLINKGLPKFRALRTTKKK